MANDILGRTQFRDPFSGGASDAAAAIGLLGDWRRLIDSNRPTRAIFGVAGWKRPTVDALLWNGSAPPPYGPSHVTGRRGLGKGDAALLWKSRVAKTLEPDLARRGVRIGEIEDGFIRSSGLGANCVPPLSIAVDYCGAHFDPAQPSDLELILQNADIDPAMIARAAALRERLVATGISKYGHDAQPFAKAGGARRHVLVTGQVEDDRSVLTGGGGISNLDLLRQARALEPDAYLIYKPHPDVEAGHRKGRIADSDALALADQVERHAPIAGILASVDAIHVITSLAGFEGLMRGKQVVAHGTPFFAGWGLTTDLGSVPARRTRRRTLDELVAATLILYPRYLDPVSGLPCPVETLVDRMAVGETATITPLVRLRQWQGKVNVFFRAWGHGHDQAK
jgi:capsular polysaccharide export protein